MLLTGRQARTAYANNIFFYTESKGQTLIVALVKLVVYLSLISLGVACAGWAIYKSTQQEKETEEERLISPSFFG